MHCAMEDLGIRKEGRGLGEGEILEILNTIGIPTDLTTLGIDSDCAKQTFRATKDIRDKYVLSRLAWDLGILEELCQLL